MSDLPRYCAGCSEQIDGGIGPGNSGGGLATWERDQHGAAMGPWCPHCAEIRRRNRTAEACIRVAGESWDD